MSKWPKFPSSFFQNAGTILALAISALALFVSVYEANLLKTQQKALVWPYLKVSANYSARGFSFIATNNGTGPALVKSVELLYKGEAMGDYDELLDNIKPDRKIGYDRIKMASFNGTVMKSGETRELFNMPWDEETRQMADSIKYVEIKVQYCSVLDDCWVYDSQTQQHQVGKFKAKKDFNN